MEKRQRYNIFETFSGTRKFVQENWQDLKFDGIWNDADKIEDENEFF